MAPAQFKVVIVGGGIAGLALGVMLERAGIDYIILEAAQEIRPLGAVVYLGKGILFWSCSEIDNSYFGPQMAPFMVSG